MDTKARAEEIFQASENKLYKQTDRVFAYLMIIQWLAGIAAALIISPRTWIGDQSQIHLHVYAAIFLGGIIAILPIVFAFTRPGTKLSRYTIAVSQMLFSALLIHLTGGRIETHFHVFGSLAFLAFYKDWKVLLIATPIVALDHFIRGLYYPQSVFGVFVVSEWRWLEHTAWVIFEDIFLLQLINEGVKEMKANANKEANLEVMNRELRRSNEELEQFAYVASHDLQEPLRMVIQNTQRLKIQLGDNLDDKSQRYIDFTTKGAYRMQRLIEDLLDFSRATRMNSKFQLVDLNQALDSAKQDLNKKIQETGAKIKSNTLPKINGDVSQLERLFLNLLSNSLKYSHKDRKPEINIEVNNNKDHWLIEIKDNGIGFRQEYAERIFLLFQRLHNQDEYPGTGIGLTICKKIIAHHGGEISVISQEGIGTSFFIKLYKD